MMRGWIYVLSHSAMPGLVKVGQTGSDPKNRADQLFTTALPGPFTIEYSGLYDAYEDLERRVHLELAEHRVNNGREFFKVDARVAVQCVRKCAGTDPLFEEINYSDKAPQHQAYKQIEFEENPEKKRAGLFESRIDGKWSQELGISIPWRYDFCHVCAKVNEHAVPPGSSFWACCKCDKPLFL